MLIPLLQNLQGTVSLVPFIDTIAPQTGEQGDSVNFVLTGSNFTQPNLVVAISGTGVTVTNVTAVTSTTITGTFVIDVGATVSARSVTVTTDSGTSNAKTFTVTLLVSLEPSISSLSPTAGVQGSSVNFVLIGTNFNQPNPVVAISGTGVTVTNVVIVTSTTITGTFVIDSGATVSSRSVTVTTDEGTSGTATFAVTLLNLVPSISSLSPHTGAQGDSVNFVLTGTNFDQPNLVVAISGTGVTVTNVVIVTATALTGTLVITSGATVSARFVTVTTDEGTSNSRPFTVTPLVVHGGSPDAFGEFFSIPGQEVIGGPWGAIRTFYKPQNCVKIEYRRRGAELEEDDTEIEMPERYVSYVRHFAMWQALSREGDGQDLELATHYRKRFEAGVARVNKRRQAVQSQRKWIMGGGSQPQGRRPERPRLPYPYGSVR